MFSQFLLVLKGQYYKTPLEFRELKLYFFCNITLYVCYQLPQARLGIVIFPLHPEEVLCNLPHLLAKERIHQRKHHICHHICVDQIF